MTGKPVRDALSDVCRTKQDLGPEPREGLIDTHGRRYSDEEFALILKRAAELQDRADGAAAQARDRADGVSSSPLGFHWRWFAISLTRSV